MMDDFSVSLKILNEILCKKKDALTAVLDISANQEKVLSGSPSDERTSEFSATAAEKQSLIDKILEYDEVFQGVFSSIRAELNGRAKDSRKEILAIQALIKEVTALDVAIRAQELKNSALIGPQQLKAEPVKKAYTQTYRRQILTEYDKHKKITPEKGRRKT